MRVHVGADHAGFEFKALLVAELTADGHEVVDHGPAGYDAQDDYPPYCLAAAAAVLADEGSRGVVIGGSGNGEQIAANKVVGIRAALAWDENTARLAREHNDAQVVSIGARMHAPSQAVAIVRAFLGQDFSDEERHARRIAQLDEYERTRVLPATGSATTHATPESSAG